MKAISLFSGVGMFDLGVSLAGYDIAAQVEIDDYCRRVLKRHAQSYWPNAAQFADVCEFGRNNVSGRIDLIYGGFPCQPHSVAGNRQGDSDSRNLWPEFKRIIGEIRPRAVLLENVTGITQSYTVEGELRPAYALTVIADLATLGYDAQWGIISAADAGAPHQRERWWCVAYAQRDGHDQQAAGNGTRHAQQYHTARKRRRRAVIHAAKPGRQAVADAAGTGSQKRQGFRGRIQSKRTTIKRSRAMANTDGKCSKKPGKQYGSTKAANRRRAQYRPGLPGRRASQSRMGGAAHGLTARLDGLRWPAGQDVHQHEWEAPRTVAQKEAHHKDRIKALGNGGMWPVVYALACGIRERLNTRSNAIRTAS